MAETYNAIAPIVLVAPNMDAPPSSNQFLAGSRFDNQNLVLIKQTLSALWSANDTTTTQRDERINACLEVMAGIAPKDDLEGLLAGQMIACHSAAMERFRRAMFTRLRH